MQHMIQSHTYGVMSLPVRWFVLPAFNISCCAEGVIEAHTSSSSSLFSRLLNQSKQATQIT